MSDKPRWLDAGPYNVTYDFAKPDEDYVAYACSCGFETNDPEAMARHWHPTITLLQPSKRVVIRDLSDE